MKIPRKFGKKYREDFTMAKVKDMIDKLTGQTEARERATREVTELVEKANLKLNDMENKLREKFRNRELESQMEIVGDRMGAFSREYRVNYSDGDMSKAVSELVDEIMNIGSDSAKNIISRTISNALRAMFTSVVISEEEKQMFVVMLEGAALVRYDIDIWKSAEADSALFQHCQSVVAITYARSVVDHTKITDDELNDAINSFLGNASLDEVIAYKKKLIELLKINVNGDKSADDAVLTSGDDKLIPLMSSIPVNTALAGEFAENRKITEGARYVEALIAGN